MTRVTVFLVRPATTTYWGQRVLPRTGVETAPTRRLFAAPRRPYTRALFSAMPSLDPDERGRAQRLSGEIPSPIDPPSGCCFHPRCLHAAPICSEKTPRLEPTGDESHTVACYRFRELEAAGVACIRTSSSRQAERRFEINLSKDRSFKTMWRAPLPTSVSPATRVSGHRGDRRRASGEESTNGPHPTQALSFIIVFQK